MDGRHLLILPALLAVLAPSCGDAASRPLLAQPSGKLPANLSPTFPRSAVDHVITYAAWRGWGPKGGDRIITYRHGALVRTDTDYIGSKRANEASHSEQYSNLATAAALDISLDENGVVSSVSIMRGGADDIPIYRNIVVANDDAETIAGERCQVWVAKPETKEGVAHTSCITADGIVLRETDLYHDGSVMNERRAIRIERRHVRSREVLPPTGVLRWSSWTKRSTSQTGEGPPANYDIKLVGKKDGEFLTKNIRKAGTWYSEQDDADTVARTMQIIRPDVTLSYYNRAYPQMSISRGVTSILKDPRIFQSAPLNKPTEEIIGESCTWYNAAVNVADYGRLECRSRDELPMRRDEYSRGGLRASWKATALKRGQTQPSSIRPPPLLTDWAFWGWPELSGR